MLCTPTPPPRSKNFCPFRSMMSCFWITAQYWEKCTEWPQTTMTFSKVKNTNMHATYAPEAHIFVRFTLRWAVFELHPFIRKSAQNDPEWPWHVQGEKYQYVCYIHPTHEAQIFICLALRLAVFELCLFFRKSAPNDPKITLTCSRSNIPICILHAPLRHIFSSVSLYDEPFLSYGPFEFPIEYNAIFNNFFKLKISK